VVAVINVGVLAFQGSVVEHVHALTMIKDVRPYDVKTASDLEKVSGLILPGGESTTIGKLLKEYELLEPIKKRVKEGMPIWGTCAGMILIAKQIINENHLHLAIMDISVRRNAYGSQLDSFRTTACIPQISKDEIPLIFIRAPWVENVGQEVRILLKVTGKIVAVQQNNMLATSFHPELTQNLAFHKYFMEMVKNTSEIKRCI